MSLTYSQAVEQTITAGEQIHQIVNGTATTEVTVEDGSKVPSIRKALIDNFYFKDPITWQAGQTENVFNQLRQFTDGSWWYAPSATASNPISMGGTPIGDSLWKIYDFDAIGKLEPRINEALRRSYAEAGYDLIGGFGDTGLIVDEAMDVVLWEPTGVAYAYIGILPHTIGAGESPVGNPLWVAKDATILRSDISVGGSFAISGAVTAAASNLRSITPSDGLRLLCLGHSAVRDGGEGIFQYDSSLPKTMHDGGWFISPTVPAQALAGFILGTGETVPTGNGVWVRIGVTGKPHRLREYGISGSDDDSAAMSAFMQKLAGKKWLIDSTPAVFNVGMTGAAYNGTEIRFAPGCAIKNKSIVLADAGLFGTRAAFYIKDVDGVSGDWYGDGNRLGQPDAENCHNLAIYGAKNIDFEVFRVKELRGDGCYISQSNAQSSSTNPSNINFGDFYAYNSVDDGRNGLSIIAGDFITAGKFRSINVGGVVGGVRQPGGFDIEPNLEYQTVSNVKIGSIYVDTVGSNGLTILGKGTSPVTGNVTDVDFGNYTVIIRNSYGTLACAVCISHAENVRGKGSANYKGAIATQNVGLIVDAASRVDIEHVSYNCAYGAELAHKNRVVESNIKVTTHDYKVSGVVIGAVAGCNIDVVARRSQATAGVPVAFYTEYVTKQASNCVFNIVAPFGRTATTKGVINDPAGAITFQSCKLIGDLAGYSSFDNAINGCGAGLKRADVLGINWANSLPTNGTWNRGDFVSREGPTPPVSNKLVTGWLRLTNGNTHVLNVDWAQLISETAP